MGLGYESYGTVMDAIGIGLGLTATSHSQLPESNNFEDVIRNAYKLMFSMAAQTQMTHNTATVFTSVHRLDTVMMLRAFAIAIEVLLGVVAGISWMILILNARRTNKLQQSLTHLMLLSSLIASQPFLISLAMHEMATDPQLNSAYGDLKFALRDGPGSSIRCVSLLSDPPKQSAHDV